MAMFSRCKKAELTDPASGQTVSAGVSTGPLDSLILAVPPSCKIESGQPMEIRFLDPTLGVVTCRCKLSAPPCRRRQTVYRLPLSGSGTSVPESAPGGHQNPPHRPGPHHPSRLRAGDLRQPVQHQRQRRLSGHHHGRPEGRRAVLSPPDAGRLHPPHRRDSPGGGPARLGRHRLRLPLCPSGHPARNPAACLHLSGGAPAIPAKGIKRTRSKRSGPFFLCTFRKSQNRQRRSSTGSRSRNSRETHHTADRPTRV